MNLQKKSTVYYLDSKQQKAPYYLSLLLLNYMKNNVSANQPVIVLCVGSDRVPGDSLGPLVGYKLSKARPYGVMVYGTLNNPVHALNLEETAEKIKSTYKDAFIIAIDASLGTKEHLGFITFADKALKPGAGISKNLTAVGNISITGIVNTSGSFEHLVLQTTRLSTVMELADCIVEGILQFSQIAASESVVFQNSSL